MLSWERSVSDGFEEKEVLVEELAEVHEEVEEEYNSVFFALCVLLKTMCCPS